MKSRQEITLWQQSERLLGVLSAQVGGWSLSPHHGYDSAAAVLFLGTGTRRGAQAPGLDVITTVAGSHEFSVCGGDGGPATKATLS